MWRAIDCCYQGHFDDTGIYHEEGGCAFVWLLVRLLLLIIGFLLSVSDSFRSLSPVCSGTPNDDAANKRMQIQVVGFKKEQKITH